MNACGDFNDSSTNPLRVNIAIVLKTRSQETRCIVGRPPCAYETTLELSSLFSAVQHRFMTNGCINRVPNLAPTSCDSCFYENSGYVLSQGRRSTGSDIRIGDRHFGSAGSANSRAGARNCVYSFPNLFDCVRGFTYRCCLNYSILSVSFKNIIASVSFMSISIIPWQKHFNTTINTY